MNKYTTASTHIPCITRWLTVEDLSNDGTWERRSQDTRPRATKYAHREGGLLVLSTQAGLGFVQRWT